MNVFAKTLIVIGILAAVCFIAASSMDLFPFSGKEEAASASERAPEARAPRPSQSPVTIHCVPAIHPEVSPQDLLELRSRAREMAGERHFAAALTEFRRIGAIDPGFPGLNLDMSMSLLQLKQTEEAKAAIDAQLAISECLEKLPPDQFEAYCKAELFQGPATGCQQHLQDIRQSAHLEAALVQMELGHSMTSRPAAHVADASQEDVQPSRRAASAVQPGSTALQPRATSGKKPGDRSLELGAGTDTQLGAYSK